MFPSPCGVKVVANDKTILPQMAVAFVFPSPCGVKVVANLKDIVSWTLGAFVSVPLRGKGCGKL